MKMTDQDLMQYSIEQIEKYDWDAPIDENPELAHMALNLCYKRLFMPWLNMGWPPKRPISICMGCKKTPYVTWRHGDNGKQVGITCMEHGQVLSCQGDGSTLNDIVNRWNEMQNSLIKPIVPNGPKSLDELLEQVEPLTKSQKLIAEVCDAVKSLLLEKNRKYGDSALNPCRIFAKSDSVEQIKVRIDDKLNRIRNEQGDEDEDVVQDLIGYLVLLRCARKMKQEAGR